MIVTTCPEVNVRLLVELVIDQNTPSDEWNIIHNMNGYPNITILDSEGNLIEGDVRYVDLNNIIVAFSKYITGKAILR